MAEDQRRQAGKDMMKKVTQMPGEPGDPATPFMEFVNDFIFGEIWTHTELGMKERRLISLTCTAFSSSDVAKQSHIRGAYQSGDLSAAELHEFVLHLAGYAGMPKAVPMHEALLHVLSEDGA